MSSARAGLGTHRLLTRAERAVTRPICYRYTSVWYMAGVVPPSLPASLPGFLAREGLRALVLSLILSQRGLMALVLSLILSRERPQGLSSQPNSKPGEGLRP